MKRKENLKLKKKSKEKKTENNENYKQFSLNIIPGSLMYSLAAACTDPAGLLPTH